VTPNIVPDRRRNVGQNHAHPRPDDNQDEPEDAFCNQKVDKKPDDVRNVGIKRLGHLLQEMKGDDTLPEANEGASEAEVMVGDRVDDEAEAKAKGDSEEVVHDKGKAGIDARRGPPR
jgi:hypothetical protein